MFNELFNLQNILPSFLLVLCRVSGFVLMAPVFSSPMISRRIKSMLVFLLSVSLYALINPDTSLKIFSVGMFAAAFIQVIVGLIIGIILQITFDAFVLAGELVALQSGLGFATLVNPQGGGSIPIISQFYLLATTLIFLALNGHLQLINLLAKSLQTIPINSSLVMSLSFQKIIYFAGIIFSGAVSIALPAIIAILLVNFMFAVMMRAAPQLNIFTIGFPVTLLLGLFIFYITFSNVAEHASDLISQGLNLVTELIVGK